MLTNIINDLHRSTSRNYSERMSSEKPDCMEISREYAFDYWDGERKYGFGGYKYDGRWKCIAEKIVKKYKLTKNSKVLDIGCGKGFLAYEIEKLTGCFILGCDISSYALNKCWIPCFKFDAGKDELYGYYDLILSINTLHNLILPELKYAVQQIAVHSKNSYISMDSYRDEGELYNLQCWALTAEQFLRPEEWEFLFKEWGYEGDWEYVFFE